MPPVIFFLLPELSQFVVDIQRENFVCIFVQPRGWLNFGAFMQALLRSRIRNKAEVTDDVFV